MVSRIRVAQIKPDSLCTLLALKLDSLCTLLEKFTVRNKKSHRGAAHEFSKLWSERGGAPVTEH